MNEDKGPGPLEEVLQVRTSLGPVPLGFASSGASVYLVARSRDARWPVEILRKGVAELGLPGGPRTGTVSLIVDRRKRADVLDLFRRKYGPERFQRWYDHPARVLRVDLGGTLPAGSEGTWYYRWLENEFDNVAEDYDRHISGNRINRLLRDRSLGVLGPLFEGQKQLLEIGCGSGMETLPLLQKGHEIVAVDISERMLEVVKGKARALGIQERLQTRKMPARDLARLRQEFGEASFDGAYSTYGALNCEPDLSNVPRDLHGLLRQGRPFLAGVFNRWCLFEMLGYSLRGQPRRAASRTHRPIPVGSSRFCVDMFAHSTMEIRDLFSPYFHMERLEGVPVLLPPSDLVTYAERFSRHFSRLAGWDAGLGRRWPWYALGDHFLLTMRRTSPSGS